MEVDILDHFFWNEKRITDHGILIRCRNVDQLDLWIDQSDLGKQFDWTLTIKRWCDRNTSLRDVDQQDEIDTQLKSISETGVTGSGGEDDGEDWDQRCDAGLCDSAQEKENSDVMQSVRFERRQGIDISETEWRSVSDNNFNERMRDSMTEDSCVDDR